MNQNNYIINKNYNMNYFNDNNNNIDYQYFLNIKFVE